MPAATTHVEMARDVLRMCPEIKKKVTNYNMYFIGSQGPDLLFFSRASILPGSLHKYGNLMHAKNVWEVISFFEKYSNGDADLTSYFYGFLCHYALDSSAHPLVYAVSKKIAKEQNKHEGVVHVSLESEIDVWLLNQRGRSIQDYNVYQDLWLPSSLRDKLAKMYHEMLLAVYGFDIPTAKISHGIYEIYLWTKFIRPRKSTFESLYQFENVFVKDHSITAMMLYDTKVSNIINLEHIHYPHPWIKDETISDSFPELYAKGIRKAIKLIAGRTKEDISLNFNGTPVK